jgi:hypothetical protein
MAERLRMKVNRLPGFFQAIALDFGGRYLE